LYTCTTLFSYEFQFYVFYTIETTWMIYMWAYKTVRTFLRTCNKPTSPPRSTDEPSIFTPYFSECATITFRQITIALSTIQNSVIYICVSDSVHQIFTHLNLFIGLVNLLYIYYTMIACNNTVNRAIVKEQILKHGNLSKNIKRYDDKVTFYKLWYLTVIYVIAAER
jgi:hypothetical protein